MKLVVFDNCAPLYSRRVIRWAIAEHMTETLVCGTLFMAFIATEYKTTKRRDRQYWSGQTVLFNYLQKLP